MVQRISLVSIKKIVKTKQLKPTRGKFVYRILSILNLFIGGFLIISIWGVHTENLWIFVTSVLGIIAIGFFATWSLLSNITATLILFVVNPFKINDEIVILPEEFQGVVIDINVLFVVIESQDGNIIHIPSNFLFQKMIKTVKKGHIPDVEVNEV